MGCTEIQELLLEYGELATDARERADAHLAQCAGCREFLKAVEVVDDTLSVQFAGREVSGGFAPAVRRRVSLEAAMRRPSLIPELLDFVGWGAIVGIIGLLAWWLAPVLPLLNAKDALTLNVALAAGGAFVLVAFFIGLRSLADLKH